MCWWFSSLQEYKGFFTLPGVQKRAAIHGHHEVTELHLVFKVPLRTSWGPETGIFQAMDTTSQKEKDLISEKQQDDDGNGDVVEDLARSQMVPLAYFELEVALCKELLHQTGCARLLDLSPNGSGMVMAAIQVGRL